MSMFFSRVTTRSGSLPPHQSPPSRMFIIWHLNYRRIYNHDFYFKIIGLIIGKPSMMPPPFPQTPDHKRSLSSHQPPPPTVTLPVSNIVET